MKNTFTSLYQYNNSCVICSLKLTQRTGNSQIVEIDSPLSVVKPSFIKINTASTTHSFLIHNVKNGTFVDFINSMAVCIIKAKIPCNVVVASSLNDSFLVYCPTTNCVKYFYSENLSDTSTLSTLKKQCLEVYKLLQRQN